MIQDNQFDTASAKIMHDARARGCAQRQGGATFFLIGVLAIGGLVDWFHLIKFGEVSALALLTVLYAFLSWFLWLTQGRRKRRISPALRPFLVFLAWIVSSFIWFRPTVLGIQNFLVLLAFAGVALLSENTISQAPHPPVWVGKTLTAATFLACGLYVIFLLLDGLGTNLVFHARTFAIFVLPGLSWFLAGWRYGSKRSLICALLVAVLIILSLSRMAFAAALLLFPLAWVGGLRRRDWVRLAFVGILISATLYLAVSNFRPLRDRFALDADLFSLSVEQAADYTSGRFIYLVVTLDSALDSPWVGHGAGSTASLLSELYPTEHPLNDYLRVFHDYGLVGLILFLFAIQRFFRAIWHNWLSAERARGPQARLHLAACLAVLAVFFTMLTDNSLVYLFIMAPLGVFVGASLGTRKAVVA